MDNFKRTCCIFVPKLRQESTFSSFWKYIVLVFSILSKFRDFQKFKVSFSERKIRIKDSIVTALRKLIGYKIKSVLNVKINNPGRCRLLRETLKISSKKRFLVILRRIYFKLFKEVVSDVSKQSLRKTFHLSAGPCCN